MEFEPIKKIKSFKTNNFSKYVYIMAISLVFLIGISYGLTFFIENTKIEEMSITTQGISVTETNKAISLTGLTPLSDSRGVNETPKELTLTNTSNVNGRVEIKIERTSGVSLEDMRYVLSINDNNNDVILAIDDVPLNGVIYNSEILSQEAITLRVKLYPKEGYSGNETTFVGELKSNIYCDKMLGSTYIKNAGGLTESNGNYYYGNDANNNYVWFNCDNGYTEGEQHCSKYRIVGVENNQIVITNEYTNATGRTDSELYRDVLSSGKDSSLIKSVSTDNKNLYLVKTAIITGGSGSSESPYKLENEIESYSDRKLLGYITYVDGENQAVQPLYANQDNYISQKIDESGFQGWSDETNTYQYGDSISFNADINLTAIKTKSYYSEMLKVALIDNENSANVNNTPPGIDFTKISSYNSNSNGQGLYIRAGTENDQYPIMYYRGNVQNNNVLFGGFCWQIVRTTSTGGIKMIYNGIAENEQCLTNRTAPTGVKAANSRSQQTLGNANNTLNYYYGTNYTYDTGTKKFKLAGTVTNAKQWNDTNYQDLLGKYTCKATTAEAVCSPLYFIDEYQSATKASTTQITLTATGHYAQLGISSFNSNNTSPAYNGYMYGNVYKYNNSLTLTTNHYFGESVEKVGSNYVLQNTIDFEAASNLTNLSTHHYTCVTGGQTQCAEVAYIYYYEGSGTPYYILLSNDTLSVEAALEEMENNVKNSTIKGVIDNWYFNNLLSKASYLEDTVYCNDRGMNTVGDNQSYINNGWKANGGMTNNHLYYASYGRQNNTPSLSCSKNDAFTVEESATGNGKLTYPIGLLDADEVNLAGRAGSNYYLYTNANYWSMTPYEFSTDRASGTRVGSGNLSSDNVVSNRGVRPVISLKPGTQLGIGDGSFGSPLKIVE